MIKIKFKLSPAILQAQISNSTKALYITNGQNIFFPCKIGTFFKQAGDKKNPYNNQAWDIVCCTSQFSEL